MSEDVVEDVVAQPAPLEIDPFGFIIGVSSRIAGLGGNAPSDDPAYAFHTPYVDVARGPAQFTLCFTGLTAKRGTLVLRVHMLAKDEGATARLINSDRLQLGRLAARGGLATIRFEGFRNVSYALLGHIHEDTDAAASGLSIMLDRPAKEGAAPTVVAEARSSEFGKDAARQVAQLVTLDVATLSSPVSQVSTRAQLAEPTFATLRDRLGIAGGNDADIWPQLYVHQVQDLYGVLTRGSRGLGFGVDGGPLVAAAAARGAGIVATDRPGHGHDEAAAIEELRRPLLIDAASFAQQVTHRLVDPAAIPDDLVNFDFLWSIGVADRLGSVQDGTDFILAALECLRPGGLAVHAMAFARTAEDRDAHGDGVACFRQPDVERLSLELISRGHEVAQMKLAGEERLAAPPWFGIVARKVPSAFF